MACDNCELLKAEIKELKLQMYGDGSKTLEKIVFSATGFKGQKAELIAILYRSPRPLTPAEVNRRLPNFLSVQWDRDDASIKTHVSQINKIRPGTILSSWRDPKRDGPTAYRLSRELEASIAMPSDGES